METETGARPQAAPLTRARVLEAALDYVDEHGLEALSMHKLGARLGVQAMSLYSHVRNKGEVLDGIVEVLWSEAGAHYAPAADWPSATRSFARLLYDLVHRHPSAAPLLMSRQVLPESALRVCESYLRVLHEGGVPPECATPLVRTLLGYGFGYGLAELSCFLPSGDDTEDEVRRIRRIGALLPAHAPDSLVRVAVQVCGGCDPGTDFDTGVELMVRGLQASLTESAEPATA